MSDTTKTVEIDEAVIDEVSKKASDNVSKQLDEKLKGFKVPTAEEIANAMAEKTEQTNKKKIHDGGEEDTEGAVVNSTKSGFEKMGKEERLAEGLKAQLRKDYRVLDAINALNAKGWQKIVSKANYQNVTTAADGGALVPDPEFIAEIDRLTDDYGTAVRLATVRKTDRDSVTILSGTNEISFTQTSEATAQNAQKLTYSAQTVALLKYIATVPVTSELVEDSAIDIFQDVANEIARARAKLFDQLVFTDSSQGLLYAPDSSEAWKTQTVGSAITDLDFDDLFNARYKVKTAAQRNGKYFMHPTVWNYLRQKKSGDGSNSSAIYYAGSPLEGSTPTVDGIEVVLVDVLPAYGEITANEPFAVYGDLSRVMIHNKRLLETKVFDAGVVKDAGGSDYNLITQDSYAVRATLRTITQTRFPEAFCIIGTGTVS